MPGNGAQSFAQVSYASSAKTSTRATHIFQSEPCVARRCFLLREKALHEFSIVKREQVLFRSGCGAQDTDVRESGPIYLHLVLFIFLSV